MTHRVHTILSILAEDYAPAALRPSILLAIDWPTVAEEAPATEHDAHVAYHAGHVLSGSSGLPGHTPATLAAFSLIAALIAARLATVAASLTTTGDKAHALHAAALWGAAAALVGLPTTSQATELATPDYLGDRYITALANKASDIVGGGIIAAGPAEKATLIATALDRVHELNTSAQAGEHRLRDLGWDSSGDPVTWARDKRREHDKALADIHALRDILKVPAGGNIVDHADAAMKGAAAVREDNARLRAQVDRMIAAMRDDAPTPTPTKPRPQPGDVVPWIETEDGCLYADDDGSMLAQWRGRCLWVWEPSENLYGLLTQDDGWLASERKDESGPKATIVARDLGTDPEAWRAAMREWMANHATKSHAPDRISCPHRQDGDASACDHCCMFG